jgi:AraC family transcriptional regulator
MGGNPTIEWVQARTERPQPLALFKAAGIAAPELLSGDIWTGIRFEQLHATGSGELPEGFLPRHVVAINVGSAIPVDVSWVGEPPPTKHFVAPGNVSFFPALTPYVARWHCCDNHLTILVEIAPEFVAAVSNEGGSGKYLHLRPAYDDKDPFIAHLGLALRDDLRTGQPNGCVYGETLGAALSVRLVQRYGGFEQTFRQYRSGLPKYQLRHVIQYIDENLEKAISLLDLAKVAQISVYHFVRLFKQSTGLSPHQYILQKRIGHAKSLLQDLGLPIAEVALRSGFGSQSSFTRAFQRLTYFTPRIYRNRVSDNIA